MPLHYSRKSCRNVWKNRQTFPIIIGTEKADIAYYDRNRETLYEGLKKAGLSCIKPEGAFYLFMKSPIEDEKEFCRQAKELHILLVPGSSFGCGGYVRIAYCVSYETIVNALPKFKELAKKYF